MWLSPWPDLDLKPMPHGLCTSSQCGEHHCQVIWKSIYMLKKSGHKSVTASQKYILCNKCRVCLGGGGQNYHIQLCLVALGWNKKKTHCASSWFLNLSSLSSFLNWALDFLPPCDMAGCWVIARAVGRSLGSACTILCNKDQSSNHTLLYSVYTIFSYSKFVFITRLV